MPNTPEQQLAELLADSASPRGQVSSARYEHVTVVTLNRPDKHNSITLEMWRELASVVRGASRIARVIVLRGEGSAAFSVGADITEFPTARAGGRAALDYSRAIGDAIETIRESPVPVVAMIRGLAVGGGCELATACDVRIAEGGARMGIPIGRLGVTLGLAEASALVDLIGLGRARSLVLSGRLVDAAEAERIGLLDLVSHASSLAADTAALVLQMAASAPLTVASTKRVLSAAARGSTRVQAEAFAEELFAVYEGADLAEGIEAFRSRRDPQFSKGGTS